MKKFRYSGYNAYGVVSRCGWYSRCRIEVRVGGLQVLSVKVSHRTSGDLDLVVGDYGGVPLQAR